MNGSYKAGNNESGLCSQNKWGFQSSITYTVPSKSQLISLKQNFFNCQVGKPTYTTELLNNSYNCI
jgi:hypothetical protein